jgi:hypothetical protein
VTDDKGPRRQLPPWLLGLILAVVIFAAVILILDVLGFGDDPAIESAIGGLPALL